MGNPISNPLTLFYCCFLFFPFFIFPSVVFDIIASITVTITITVTPIVVAAVVTTAALQALPPVNIFYRIS